MKPKRTVLLAVAGIALAGVLAWWVQQDAGRAAPAAAAKPADATAAAVAVEVGAVRRVRLADDAEAVGTLRSRQRVVLRPEVSGRVAAIGFTEGQRVRRGQLLVQLDDTLQRAQLRQAQAQAGIAQTQHERNRELVAQNFVSRSALDQSAAAVEVAQAEVVLTQAQLARMRLVAPFDGLAGLRQFDVGDYVRDGTDLVNIEDDSQMLVDYRLPERYLARVRTGQAVQVQVDALPGRPLEGRVEALDAQVDADGRSLLVRARLDNRDGSLRAGMFARARTTLSVREGALVVPEEALVPEGGKQYLIKVVEDGQGRVSQRIEARLGARVLGQVEVLDGVAEGDLVVTAGQSRLMRGASLPLRIVQIGPAAASAPASAAPGSAASVPPQRPAA